MNYRGEMRKKGGSLRQGILNPAVKGKITGHHSWNKETLFPVQITDNQIKNTVGMIFMKKKQGKGEAGWKKRTDRNLVLTGH
jgi:hypothetical protein